MSHLNDSQYHEIRNSLEQMSEELSELLQISEEASDTVQLDQTKVGRVSRVDALQQQAMAQANFGAYEKRLKLVRKAIKKLNEEEYGFCEECDEEIPFARLSIRPESRCCIVCQEKKEQQ